MGTAVLGAGPAGLTAAYVLGAARRSGGRLRGRRHRRRHREDGRVQRLPLRPRRPPLLHEVRAGAAPVGGDARRRAARAPAALAHLLRREVLRVPAAGPGRRRAARRRRVGAVLALVLPQPAVAVAPRDRDVRGLGHDAELRHAALRRRSSARTRRRCGASRARRSTPSGRRSGSRTSRSGRRCSRRSHLTRDARRRR